MQVTVALIVVQVHVGKVRRTGAQPVFRENVRRAGIGVAEIEADTQARVMDGLHDRR